MLKRATAVLGATVMAVLGLAVPAGAAEADQRVIVQLRPSTSLSAATSDVADDGGTVSHRYTKVFRGYAAEVSESQLRDLRSDPDVLSVVRDTEQHLAATQPGPTWGLDRTDQRLRPLDAGYTYSSTGAGVTAFVVDTGTRPTHTDFGGRVVGGTDLVSGDSLPNDECNGHGTHVSGTIGGATYGIAKDVTIVPVRTFDCAGAAAASTIVAAFEWVIAHKTGPSILNYSAGGSANTAIDAAAQAVLNAGITLVVAAGNDGTDSCYDSPARVPGALTVGASTNLDHAPYWSNYGDCIDLFAPGENITSAWYTSDSATVTDSGTSMAAPHVAGAAARYLETHPAAAPAEVAAFLNSRATPGVVLAAYSANNNLLYLDGGADTGPAPALVPPTIVSGQITPGEVTFTDDQPRAYSVTVQSSQRLVRLRAYLDSPASSYNFLDFANPSGDGVTWTTSGEIYSNQDRGVWTVTDYDALWSDSGALRNKTLAGVRPTLGVLSPVVAPPAVISTPTPAPTLTPTVTPAPTPTTAPPKASLPAVRTKLHVTKVRYNGPGADTKRTRNREYVRITNTSGTAYSLKGYRLKDGDGSTYTFPATTLGAKKSIVVYTGKGTNTSTTRYWNNAKHVWDNKGTETVTLQDTYRRTVNKHTWTSKKAGEITWS